MNKERGIILSGNWKMNHTQEQTKQFFNELGEFYSKLTDSNKKNLIDKKVQTILFPPFLSLESALDSVKYITQMQVGSQNTHWSESGAFTGEVSFSQLKEIGVNVSLVGHSERRQFFGETNETVQKRCECLVSAGMSVMLCIGETLAQRDSGNTFKVLEEQLACVFNESKKKEDFATQLGKTFFIAYEPVWAIGTGKTATPSQAEEAHLFIREYLRKHLSQKHSEGAYILYGGSVKPDNIKELLICPNIDGALVGGASLKSADFFQMLTSALSFF